MASNKNKTAYVCSACGGQSTKWTGRCSHCGEWNTLSEFVPSEDSSNNRYSNWAGSQKALSKLSSIQAESYVRLDTRLEELNRTLGGGLVPGSVTLLGGDPGIGKSTLLLQAMYHLHEAGHNVVYITGEESAEQVAIRAQRLGVGHADFSVLVEIELERILAVLQAEKPAVVVIDSVQTLYSASLQAAPGTVSQVRECAAQLTRQAKSQGISLILVGHVTKEGSLAGPRVLEHIVDTVLYFEGEPGSSFRMVRAWKNRFGAANELGVFEMTDRGLLDVANASALFLTAHDKPVEGSCILAATEGNRPFLVEVQALVEEAPTPNPRRFAAGVDTGRLQMLLAVLNKHAGLSAFDQNVYVKVVGGLRLTEPAADLAVMLSVYSSLTGKVIPSDMAVFGEVGLAGELRPVNNVEYRVAEAHKLGFKTVMLPKQCNVRNVPADLNIVAVGRVEQALSCLKGLKLAA